MRDKNNVRVPDVINCDECDHELMRFSKSFDQESKTHLIHTSINFPKPPEIVDQKNHVGLITCPSCAAKTSVDVRLFALVRLPTN